MKNLISSRSRGDEAQILIPVLIRVSLRRLLLVLLVLACRAAFAGLPDADALSAIEATDTIPSSSLPMGGLYYSAANPNGPPMPGSMGYDAWQIDSNTFLLDDLDSSSGFSGRGMGMMDDSSPPGFDDGGDGTNYYPSCTYTFDTNSLWLQIMNVSGGLAYVNLMNATDSVYEIFSKTDLTLTNWTIEQEVWPTDTNTMPFIVPESNRTNLFLWARDWTGITSNGNTTPEWWFWKYFGTVDLLDTDVDGQGNMLYVDYADDDDPNVINFSLQFTNDTVNTSPANGMITIQSGMPSYEAILVNDTNTADAVWQPYTSTNVAASLDSGNGLYNVMVGLRGLPADAQQSWVTAQLTLNDVAPVFVVTNPTTSTVSTPMIQLQGYVGESLGSLTYDVSNAAGIFTNQTGYVTSQFYDTNLLAFTTNYFQCYDVFLTNGLNTITLHGTDLAGNTATASVSYTLDYSGDTTAPVLSLIWPTNGISIAGSNFTAQAQMDDDTANVSASIVDTNGDTNTVQGLVERSGAVWFNNLPLNSGTNTVTITAVDAAGNVSTADFSVVQSAVGLTTDPVSAGQMNESSVTVTGTVGDAGDNVSVNGVSADVNEDGTWEADNVPVNPTGIASLNVQVTDSSNNPVAAQNTWQAQPVSVVLADYTRKIAYDYATISRNDSIHWDYGLGGGWDFEATGSYVGPSIVTRFGSGRPMDDDGSSDTGDIPADGAGYAPPWIDSKGVYFTPTWQNATVNLAVDYATLNGAIATKVMLAPSGQTPPGQNAIYLVRACAMEFSDPYDDDENLFDQNFSGSSTGDTPLPPEWLKIQGSTLIPTTDTNDDGSVWGQTIISAPAGTTPDVTPTAAQLYGYNDYTFNVQATNVQLKIFAITNGTAIDLSTNTPEFCVGQQVTFSNAFDPPITNIVASKVIKWTLTGNYVNNDTPGSSTVSTNYFADFNMLTNETASAWWVSGGSPPTTYTVALAENLTLNNGQQIIVTAKGLFNMFRPNVAMVNPTVHGTPENIWLTGYPDSYPAGPAWTGLEAGIIGLGVAGTTNNIDYLVRVVSSDFSGDAKITQICAINTTHSPTDINITNQLDNSDPYGSDVENPSSVHVNKNSDPSGTINEMSLDDAPRGGGFGSFHFNGSFVDYVMFNPNSSSSDIYIPLGKVIWHTSFAATYPSVTINSNSVSGPTSPDNSDDFPTWTDTFHNSN
jgi:hypothetical protein